MAKAYVDTRINEKSGRLAKHYKCAKCKKLFTSTNVQVNHKETVVPLTGFISWDNFIERLFCDADKLEVLCIPCHSKVTAEEKEMRKEFKTIQEKATYQSWLDMKSRCNNPKSHRYYTHGARGITVCERWVNSYDNFLEDMGYKPEGFSIERIDNDGNYEPDNCKWASSKEQAVNRRTNIFVTYKEDTLTVSQWAEVLGLSFSAMMKRFSTWDVEKAITEPVPERYKNRKEEKNE